MQVFVILSLRLHTRPAVSLREHNSLVRKFLRLSAVFAACILHVALLSDLYIFVRSVVSLLSLYIVVRYILIKWQL